MSKMGAYGQWLAECLHSDSSRSVLSRSLRKCEVGLTETRSEHPTHRLSDPIPREDAFLVTIQLCDFPDHKYWIDGRQTPVFSLRAPVLLFLIIFLWTPPHFWALSLYRADDYARAGIPMLPVVAGKARTRQQILVYTLLLVVVSIVPWATGLVGVLYGAFAILLGAKLIMLAWRLQVAGDDGERVARRLFVFSIVDLFALFAAFPADKQLPAPAMIRPITTVVS